jgi:hypothetical protein
MSMWRGLVKQSDFAPAPPFRTLGTSYRSRSSPRTITVCVAFELLNALGRTSIMKVTEHELTGESRICDYFEDINICLDRTDEEI